MYTETKNPHSLSIPIVRINYYSNSYFKRKYTPLGNLLRGASPLATNLTSSSDNFPIYRHNLKFWYTLEFMKNISILYLDWHWRLLLGEGSVKKSQNLMILTVKFSIEKMDLKRNHLSVSKLKEIVRRMS